MVTNERNRAADENFEVVFETVFGAIIVKDKRLGGQTIMIRHCSAINKGLLVVPSGTAEMSSSGVQPAILLKNKNDK